MKKWRIDIDLYARFVKLEKLVLYFIKKKIVIK